MNYENDFEIASHLKKIKAEIVKLTETEGESIDGELERIEKLKSLNDEKLEVLQHMKNIAVQRDRRQADRVAKAKASYAAISDDLINALKDFEIVAKQLDIVNQSHLKVMHLAKQAEACMNITHTGDSQLDTIAQQQRLRGILIKTFGVDVLCNINMNTGFSYVDFDLSKEIKSIGAS